MYIKTKNRIYEVESILRDDGFVKGYNVGEMAFITKNQVILQSEKLEELCDEFVGFEEGCIPFVWRFDTIDKYRERDLFIKEILENKGTEEIIYGAIWTEKGLIYVAKMNEKGELCLL